jgi:hypothetical protein
MDESQRDIYNRFGEDTLTFDPRQDELRLLSGIAVSYIMWGVLAYIFTLPASARSCRAWIAIATIVLMVVEITLCLTENVIPSWMPKHLTEHELVRYLHMGFPAVIASLRLIAEYIYVDTNHISMEALARLIDAHKVTKHETARGANSSATCLIRYHCFCAHFQGMLNVLNQMQSLVAPTDGQAVELSDISDRIETIRGNIDSSHASASSVVSILKQSGNSGSKYYWIIFVLMYGGVYLFQQ